MAYEQRELSAPLVPTPPPISKGRHLYKHGFSSSPLYRRYCGMIQRCGDPNHKNYALYGGRGIKVCERWRKSFEAFLADMGTPPRGATLDRIDNNGNYEPANCRWVPHTQNVRNKSDNRVIEFMGQRKCLIEWAEGLGIDQAALRYRLEKWPLEKALTTPNTKPRSK